MKFEIESPSLLERRERLVDTAANQAARIERLDRLVSGTLGTGPIALDLKYGLLKEQVRDREIHARQQLTEVDAELARQEAEQALTTITIDHEKRQWEFSDGGYATFRGAINWAVASYLADHPNQILSPLVIKQSAIDAGSAGIPAATIVSNLRAVIENNPSHPELLETVKDDEGKKTLGYRLKARISYADEEQQVEQIAPRVEVPVEQREQEQKRPVITVDEKFHTIQFNDNPPVILAGNLSWNILMTYVRKSSSILTREEVLKAGEGFSTAKNAGEHIKHFRRAIIRRLPEDLINYPLINTIKTESGETVYEVNADIIFIPKGEQMISSLPLPDVNELGTIDDEPTLVEIPVLPQAQPVIEIPPLRLEVKTEADVEREKAALVASLMQSRVGTFIQLTGNSAMEFSLTGEIGKLFEAMEAGVRIRNENDQPLTPAEMKAKRHEAVVWLRAIYEKYTSSDYSHPNEHVDNLIITLHLMDESTMGGHLLSFLLAEPTKKLVTDRRYQQPKIVWEWHAPAEMIRNIRAREEAERQRVRQQQPIEAETVVDFQPANVPQFPDITSEASPKPGTATVYVDPTTYDYMSDPDTLARIAALSAPIEVRDVPESNALTDKSDNDKMIVRGREKLLKRDPNIEEKLKRDLQTALKNVRVFPATSMHISNGLRLDVVIVNKIIDALGLKSAGKKDRFYTYDEVGVALIEYTREYFGMKRKTAFLPEELEALKHLAIDLYREYRKSIKEADEANGRK
ncbi:MAG: winged helix-turn-helix domain-containing protein [Candidatus Levybacteria bacterium]|nr:winged helix-turn-helix domain-containing protein [Candidatus Levybacteria bacterium]